MFQSAIPSNKKRQSGRTRMRFSSQLFAIAESNANKTNKPHIKTEGLVKATDLPRPPPKQPISLHSSSNAYSSSNKPMTTFTINRLQPIEPTQINANSHPIYNHNTNTNDDRSNSHPSASRTILINKSSLPPPPKPLSNIIAQTSSNSMSSSYTQPKPLPFGVNSAHSAISEEEDYFHHEAYTKYNPSSLNQTLSQNSNPIQLTNDTNMDNELNIDPDLDVDDIVIKMDEEDDVTVTNPENEEEKVSVIDVAMKEISSRKTTMKSEGGKSSVIDCKNDINDEKNRKIQAKNVSIDQFWKSNGKIPYIGLAVMCSTFIVFIFLYFTNLYNYLYGGITPSVCALIMILPIYYLFHKYEISLKYKSIAIQYHVQQEEKLNHEKKQLQNQNNNLLQENEILSVDVVTKSERIDKQNKEIDELNRTIVYNKRQSELFIQQLTLQKALEKTQPLDRKGKPIKKCALLHGFRKGQMEAQLELADIDDLVHMLPIVTASITLLPFGMHQTRKKLQRILEKKIADNSYLKMQFYLFLVSFLGCPDVKRLFRRHRIMKPVTATSNFYDYKWSENGLFIPSASHVYSRKNSCVSDATTMTHRTWITDTTVLSPRLIEDEKAMNHFNYNDFHKKAYNKLPRIRLNGVIMDEDFEEDENKLNMQESVIYSETDPVKLFRLALDKNGQPGFKVIVPPKIQNRFYDPINGNKNVQQLQVKAIFNSNAKPYLIDCYVNEEKTNEIKYSSSYILKQGDDLRKDAAVLKMFEFMNEIWKSKNLKYKDSNIQSLTYKCIPMGPDIGIIEHIPDCIELNKVLTLRDKLKKPENRNLYNQFIASAAGAFMAAYVMGIRDRHDDNILITCDGDDKCILFHIDFGYMFGDRVSLDTSKIAITKDMKKVIDIYPSGWNDFIHCCITSWLMLRNNANELIDFARVVFAFLYETNQIEMFLRNSLKLDITNDQIATKYIHDKLKNAPKQLKTKMKNLMHGFAQRMKSNNNVNNNDMHKYLYASKFGFDSSSTSTVALK